MKKVILFIVSAILVAQSGASIAATCTIGGITRTCDRNCGGGFCIVNPVECNAGAADGYCVICGTGGADTIAGTSGDDWVCAKGGVDIVYTYPLGEDPLAGHGDDTVDGSGGNDEIYGAAGNDDFRGDAGNDKIDGGRGMNGLIGGAGDDDLDVYPISNAGGNTLCGQEGNDRLVATGGGFNCLDGGDGQSASGTDYDCVVFNTLTGANTNSIRNCANPNPSNDIFTPPAACGCE